MSTFKDDDEDDDDWSELWFDAVAANDVRLLDAMLLNKVDIDVPNADGLSALALVVRAEEPNLATLAFLLRSGASVTVGRGRLCNPLLIILDRGRIPGPVRTSTCLYALLASGVHPDDVRDERGFTALMVALDMTNGRCRCLEAIPMLIDAGADVNFRGGVGRELCTPLIVAARLQHKRDCQMLLEQGADVNATDTNQMTALHFALVHRDWRAVNMLLEAGANPLLRDFLTRNAIDFHDNDATGRGDYYAEQEYIAKVVRFYSRRWLKKQLVEIAFGLAALDLPVLQTMAIFDAIADVGDDDTAQPSLCAQWAICKRVKEGTC